MFLEKAFAADMAVAYSGRLNISLFGGCYEEDYINGTQ